MPAQDTPSTMTQTEFVATLGERFGADPRRWAFRCPSCGDVATGQDFKDALADHPRTRGNEPVRASDILGQECIGRSLGALEVPAGKWTGRGCDWTAYGLFHGPLAVTTPEGTVYAFHIADAPTVEAATA